MKRLKSLFLQSEEIMYAEALCRMFWWKLCFVYEVYNEYGYLLPRSWRMAKDAQSMYGYLYSYKDAVKDYVEAL